MTDQNNLSRALQLLAAGRLDEARIYLDEFLRQDSDNPDFSTTWASAMWTSARSTGA